MTPPPCDTRVLPSAENHSTSTSLPCRSASVPRRATAPSGNGSLKRSRFASGAVGGWGGSAGSAWPAGASPAARQARPPISRAAVSATHSTIRNLAAASVGSDPLSSSPTGRAPSTAANVASSKPASTTGVARAAANKPADSVAPRANRRTRSSSRPRSRRRRSVRTLRFSSRAAASCVNSRK